MQNHSQFIPFIIGPTASGKTQFSVLLALELRGRGLIFELFNADTIQFYDLVKIGSAAPTIEELAGVPCHLLHIISPPDRITAGQFVNRVDALMKSSPSTLFAGVGASGFYMNALFSQMGEGEKRGFDPQVRAQVEEMLEKQGAEVLHQEMLKLDPEKAHKIHPNDHYRIQRFFEKRLTPPVAVDTISPSHLRTYAVVLDWSDDELKSRIALRTDAMLQQGLLKETEHLLSLGLGDWWPLSSIGYRSCVRVLRNELKLESLKDDIISDTWQMVRKTRPWTKRFDPESCFRIHQDHFSRATVQQVADLIEGLAAQKRNL